MSTDTIVARSVAAAGNAAARWWDAVRRRPGLALDAAEERVRRQAIHETWRDVVRETGLSVTEYTAAGRFRTRPRITRVVLTRPERFTVRLGEGQAYDDVAAAGPAIATAFGVRRILLTELADDLLEIELLSPLDGAAATVTELAGAGRAA
ncbi:hypothetical protein [Actinomycetospora flava]|uniref:Uncharacterized protein n=1 Tax=Actinomycetospora flava TaxID=3129232 RepID=A0ABU8M511_9PSEU